MLNTAAHTQTQADALLLPPTDEKGSEGDDASTVELLRAHLKLRAALLDASVAMSTWW